MAVEFSFMFMLLMLVTSGTIDAGRMVISKTMLAHAVTVGARAASLGFNTTTTAVQTAVVNAAPMLNLSSGSVNVSATDSLGVAKTFANKTRGDIVSVNCSYTFTPVTPVLTRLVTKTYNYTSKMTIP